jgi:polyhydroxyalkanoate synthase
MNYQLQHIPPSEQRREGSTWHGGRTPYPKASVEHASADLVLNAWLGRFTAYVSPAALAVAWQDWAGHLRLSPDKQVELGLLAFSNLERWLQYSASAVHGNPAEPVQPLAQDQRFADAAWHTWPYNLLSQGFLLTEQWWHRATTRVRGVSPHHPDVATFVARRR